MPSQRRVVAMARSGRFVAIRQSVGVDLVDALGANPRRTFEQTTADFAFVGGELWIAGDGNLTRIKAETGDQTTEPVGHLTDAGRLMSAATELSRSAIWAAPNPMWLQADGEELATEAVTPADTWLFYRPLRGKRIAIGVRQKLIIHDLGRGDYSSVKFGRRGDPIDARLVFAGRVIASVVQNHDRSASVVVSKPSGALIHTVEFPTPSHWSFAETRGILVVCTGQRLQAIDLRYGKRLADAPVPFEVHGLEVDANGKHITLAGFHSDPEKLSVIHQPYAELFGRSTTKRKTEPHDDPRDLTTAQEPVPTDAAAGSDVPMEASSEDTGPVVVPALIPAALGARPVATKRPQPNGADPYVHPGDHLDAMVDIIAAMAAKAIAEAWDTGRLAQSQNEPRPFESEVNALVGDHANTAADAVQRGHTRVTELANENGRRARASLADGTALPLYALEDEYGLSPTAVQILVVVAAPQIRGEVARLFGILANDDARPICDRYLVEQVLASNDSSKRNAIAAELSGAAPLLRYGLIHELRAPEDMRMFGSLTVDPVLISRLRNEPYAGAETGTAAAIRFSDRKLEELEIPREIMRDAILALAPTPDPAAPVRIVVRGRPGSGRSSLVAALAERVARPICIIDCDRMPRQARELAKALYEELRRAALRGSVPVVSGLEGVSDSDSDKGGIEVLREVLRSHPGPLAIRTTPEASTPLPPGYIEFSLPPLSESQRVEFWRTAINRAELPAAHHELLASRFRIGPGTIERVIANVKTHLAASAEDRVEDYTEVLASAARQHVDNRLSQVATRVTKLARWEQVALPEDLFDSIREFIGRVQHRRTVYEAWGFDEKMSTSRGLTALFYGPPGTGKTMVAGLIARELGLDLYRVDLAKITSKWIGETEKNLAQVFDAAEDGQAVIVFDEADSLFAKRTEVKTSVDRYANLEVNYLLQRLDTFEGVAILTTNLEGSIDNAFKRRLSLRLAFPFPDEELRVRLWSAHMPAELPSIGNFDFTDIAKRFPMSGGYIRNSVLRAAFLAAHENQPLSQAHIERAIELEYREMGKLSAGGRME